MKRQKVLRCLKEGLEQMFYGRSRYTIDKKGRMTIPSGFRDDSPNGVVVTKGLDGNLMAYAKEVFDSYADSMNSLSLTDPNMRSLRRELLGNSKELIYDAAGRVLIPLNLRKLAGIEDEVMILGVGNSLEIWDINRLAEFEEAHSDPEAQAIAWATLDISIKRGN